ncbi:MAG: chromosomal replication initiator protein DnaA [Candidatus Omnitrophica bacterium]|nr:chromosomal replication initiator protein DnaA [Candidatus Omnitrophota bacterium]
MQNNQEVWEKTKERLKERIGTIAFETWLEPLRLAESKNSSSIILEAPNNFFKDWVVKNYLRYIQEELKALCGMAPAIDFTINPQLLAQGEQDKIAVFKSRVEPAQDILKLNPRYTFENFIVGPSNNMVHAASVSVARSPAKSYNPFFIYGGVGLGKTHLLQAICHYVRAHNPNIKIAYIPAECFTNELINAIQHRSTMQFRNKYRNLDMLVLDDIHFIAGKESTQEEFFHTFNALYDAHRQIIISSDRPPKEISNLQERLVSRFAWGLIADVQPPDFETRVAILKKKIEHEPVKIPDEVIYFIAELIKTNIRELEGALIRVMAYSFLEEKTITLDLVKDVLKDLIIAPLYSVNVEAIQKTVAAEFGISITDLKNKQRSKNLVKPRQIAMYLCRELTGLSLPEIGESFGGKDHTTILYSYNKIKKDMEDDSILRDKINRIKKLIKQ